VSVNCDADMCCRMETAARVSRLPGRVRRFVAAQAIPERPPGRYRYSADTVEPTLYSSCYAAMALDLLGDLACLEPVQYADWAEYLNAHQDTDGLFRDPVIFGEGWYAGDPLWCGRAHLTCHVIIALTCLGATAERPLAWLEPWRDADRVVRWLDELDWGERVAWTGNEVMNIGTLLQYARDVHNDEQAGRGVSVMLEWLAQHHVAPETGVWGDVDVSEPTWRSQAVQAAYHLWPLFFYDGIPVPHVERAIDTVLATQNPAGGFGCGVHNPHNPLKSSACEDIDSIDPLCRTMQVTDYRRADVEAALCRAADWVLSNQVDDGGFVFIKDRPFEYGHPQLRGASDRGAMFPTWFRLLSLALIGKVLPEHPLGAVGWRFARCPGMQFWRAP